MSPRDTRHTAAFTASDRAAIDTASVIEPRGPSDLTLPACTPRLSVLAVARQQVREGSKNDVRADRQEQHAQSH